MGLRRPPALLPVWRPEVQALLAWFWETALLLCPCWLHTAVCLLRQPWRGAHCRASSPPTAITAGSGLQPVTLGTRRGPYTTGADCMLSLSSLPHALPWSLVAEWTPAGFSGLSGPRGWLAGSLWT